MTSILRHYVLKEFDRIAIGTEHVLWGLVRLSETDNTILNDLFHRYEINLTALNKQLVEKTV